VVFSTLTAPSFEPVTRGGSWAGRSLGYARFAAETFHPEFVWDMSTFREWPEQQTYDGLEGARKFLADWQEVWDEWEVETEEVLEAGDDKVVAILRQWGRSSATGATSEMHFAQVWTFKNGLQVRMQMYASPAEALDAVGIERGRRR
jgi:ketosteroid isomerase-like protein